MVGIASPIVEEQPAASAHASAQTRAILGGNLATDATPRVVFFVIARDFLVRIDNLRSTDPAHWLH